MMTEDILFYDLTMFSYARIEDGWNIFGVTGASDLYKFILYTLTLVIRFFLFLIVIIFFRYNCSALSKALQLILAIIQRKRTSDMDDPLENAEQIFSAAAAVRRNILPSLTTFIEKKLRSC